MRRTWIKLYVDQCLRGSMIAELTPEQRWMFVGLLLMAGDSPVPGLVYRRKDENGIPVGYPTPILADTLGVHESAVEPGLARMIEKQKISIDGNGAITITNWGKYQSEYERTREAPSRGVQKYNGGRVQKYGVDRERDLERDKNNTYRPSDIANEEYWRKKGARPSHKGESK